MRWRQTGQVKSGFEKHVKPGNQSKAKKCDDGRRVLGVGIKILQALWQTQFLLYPFDSGINFLSFK
jgi:hypothetical protein